MCEEWPKGPKAGLSGGTKGLLPVRPVIRQGVRLGVHLVVCPVVCPVVRPSGEFLTVKSTCPSTGISYFQTKKDCNI